MSTPTCFLGKNLRSVAPYYFEYKTPFKARWNNKSVAHVLCTELGQDPDVVSVGIDTGLIYVSANNGKAHGPIVLEVKETRDRLLQPHDIIHNRQHMHEPSIYWEGSLEGGIQVLYENPQLLVVNKPAGVATHPGGIYRYNTLTEILQNEFKVPLWPCHRLDKGTLGVLVLAKSKLACKGHSEMIQNRLRKLYLTRVKGHFPSQYTMTCPVFSLNSSGGYLNVPNSKAVPRQSTTEFELVKYSPELDQSIVKCRPISGKMHQIRIHLRNLGHPIVNDVLYNPNDAVNTLKNTIELDLYRHLNEKQVEDEVVDVLKYFSAEIADQVKQLVHMRKEKDVREGEVCSECSRTIYDLEPDRGIWLHALELIHNDMTFLTTPPEWSLI